MKFSGLRGITSDRPRLYRIGAALLSGLLMSSAFPPLDFSWAGWVSLVPITLAMIWFPSSRQWQVAEGMVFGASFFLTSLFWVTEVTWVGWCILSLVMAVYPALWFNLMAPVLGKSGDRLTSLRNLNRASLAAFLWVGLEWVRGWFLTGFPWNFLGVSQWKMVGVIQIAEWGGVLLVSWLVAFISVVLALTIARLIKELKRRQKMRPHFEFTLGMMILGLVILYGIHVIFEKDAVLKEVEVLAVQPDIPQDPWQHVMSLEEAVAKLEVLSISGLNQHQGQVDLVVWPETPVGEELYSSAAFREALQTIAVNQQTPLLFGSIVYAGTNLYNAAMLYPAGGGSPQLYYKKHLVILGETVPLVDKLPWIRKVIPLSQNFTPGTAATVLSTEIRGGQTIRMAPLICFEDIFGRLARRYADTPADFLVNITNDGWFNQSAQSRQHFANAVFRAVENRMPLLRVSNNGITGLIDHKGVIKEGGILGDLNQPSAKAAGTLQTVIRIPPRQRTLYQKWGDWIGILGGFGILCFLPFWWRERSFL